ncbi:hypothetical protein PSN_1685 [Pseudomonas sp. NGC7]
MSWGRFAAHRWQASSHSYPTGFKACAVPVGAGLPAIGGKAPAKE